MYTYIIERLYVYIHLYKNIIYRYISSYVYIHNRNIIYIHTHIPPGGADRIFVVAPAEDTFIGACERGRSLHALVAGNAIEGVFVTPSPSPQHGFCPTAEFDAAVRAHELVALLRKAGSEGRVEHLLRPLVQPYLTITALALGDDSTEVLYILQHSARRTAGRVRCCGEGGIEKVCVCNVILIVPV
jgi:hypothetical protein